MPNLPAVFVELKASTASFTSSFDQAKKTVNDFSSQSTSGMQKFEQVGKIAFLGLAGAATAFGGIAVKAALEGEAAHAQLVQAVTNSGTAFAAVGGQVEAMSAKFAKLGFANDQVETALAAMVRATGDVKLSLSEMGLAADIARAKHMDLAETATGLGKILEGNTRPMASFGLSAKDAAGNTLTATAAIKELGERFGGAAQANANTYAGKLQAMNAEWHNMTEVVGGMLLPVLADVAGTVADVVGWFEKHRAVALALAGVIGGPLLGAVTVYAAEQAVAFAGSVAQSIGSVAKAMFGLVPAAEAAEGAEAGLATSSALATGGLSLVGAGIGLLAAHFLGHASATKDVGAAAKGAADSVAGFGDAETGAAGGVDAMNGPLNAQATLFKTLSGGTDALSSEILKLIGDQDNLDGATQRLKDTTGANSEVSKQAAQHTKDLAAAQKDVTSAADDVTSALKRQTDAKKKLDDLMKPQTEKNIIQSQDDFQAAQDRVAETSEALTDKQKALTDAVAKYGPQSKEVEKAQWDYNAALRDAHDATNALTDAEQALADTYRPTIGTVAQLADATSGYNDATKGLTDAQGKQKDAQDKLNVVLANRDKVIAAKTDAKNAGDATLAWSQAATTLNGDWATFQATLAQHPELIGGLAAQVRSMRDNLPKGADTKPLTDLLDKILKVAAVAPTVAPVLAPTKPSGPQLDITGKPILPDAPTDDQLRQWWEDSNIIGAPTPDIGTLRAEWNDTSKRSGVYGLHAVDWDKARRAAGGPVFPGMSYLVGEEGPEILRMGSMGGSVIPNGAGMSMGPVTINVNGATGDPRAIALAVRDELIALGNRSGGTGLN